MTDRDVYNKYRSVWLMCGYSNYSRFMKTIPTNDFIKYINFYQSLGGNSYEEILELKTRTDVPDEMKLELLLTIGDECDLMKSY